MIFFIIFISVGLSESVMEIQFYPQHLCKVEPRKAEFQAWFFSLLTGSYWAKSFKSQGQWPHVDLGHIPKQPKFVWNVGGSIKC